ncbi:MAG: cyclic nucleotide-binding domain-containing protein, partial [Flavobacterium sp.]
ILVIESDLKVLKVYTETLKLSGYQVITAIDGDSGINKAISNTPHLILCNATLGHIDGFCVLAVLSKNSITAHIPFIFISTVFRLDTLRRGMDMGADDFITRPFQDDQLIRAVEFRINKLKKTDTNFEKLINVGDDNIDNIDCIPNIYEIISQSNYRRFKKNQTLYFEGDHTQGVYFLDEGSIKTFKLNSDGRELITNLYQPKTFIGLGYLLLNSPLADTAEALENCSVYFTPKKVMLELLDEYPTLNQHFIKILSINLKQKEDQLLEIAYESVTKRLSKVLIRLNKNASPIDYIAITRDDLAGLTGIATETVSRILSDFKHQNLIEKNGGLIHIINLKKLQELKN